LRGGDSPLLLDAGCGEGRNTRYFASLGYRVLGVDSNEGMVRSAVIATPKDMLDSGTVRYDSGDVTNMNFDEPYFDGVLCNETLQLVPVSRREAVLQKLMRITRPGGFHIVSTYVGPAGSQTKVRPVTHQYLPNIYNRSGWDLLSVLQEPYKEQDFKGATIIGSIACVVAVKP
jgi:ubiquinone/menaquinone biosynthesis C-methylase UbiE